jgi:hypothetical protein
LADVILTKEQRHEMASRLIADMRALFQSRNWKETLSVYEKFKKGKASKGLRVEAACLAVSALAAAGDRHSAKETLKTLYDAEYPKAAHYVFLARACIDTKQYMFAAHACARAEVLRTAEDEAKKAKAFAIASSPEKFSRSQGYHIRAAEIQRQQFE